jgi:hypothetical protein
MIYVFYYKLSLKYGFRKKLFPIAESIKGPFFLETEPNQTPIHHWNEQIIKKADQYAKGIITYFSYHQKKMESSDDLVGIPDWFYNPFDHTTHTQSHKHWTEIDDFGEGDIKIIWEPSRFDWLTDLARAYKVSGKSSYLLRMNVWLNDWCKHNPTNLGPNWKCGQESSFRIMKLLTTAKILNQLDHPSPSLKTLIYQHVVRVHGNINYGIAQENNHSTSEAIGLYVGSLWLIKNKHEDSKLNHYKNQGRALLEKMIEKLVLEHGTFSQLSTNYHRVFLDTMSFCIDMMEYYDQAPFDPQIQNKLQKSGEWLYKMIFGKEGDVPNFGSNDGAMIENLHSCDYRDFRPSVQLIFALLNKVRIYDNVDVSEAMFWRCGKESLNYPLFEIKKLDAEIIDNQIVLLKNAKARIFMKVPDRKFRQGNDAFHVDLWINEEPVLIDSGTYSYNAGELTDYFKSVSAHNTVQFGNEEQMPKIGRFLNGKWIALLNSTPIEIIDDKIIWSGTYKDFRQNTHNRKLTLSPTTLLIEDSVSSSFEVTSRYHFDKNNHSVQVHSDVKSEASLYYLEQHETLLYEEVKQNNDHKRREIRLNFEINFS